MIPPRGRGSVPTRETTDTKRTIKPFAIPSTTPSFHYVNGMRFIEPPTSIKSSADLLNTLVEVRGLVVIAIEVLTIPF